MWMPGALIGGMLAYLVYSDAWPLGVIIGAVAGLLSDRVVRKPGGDRRLAEAEARIAELHDRLDWLDRRLAVFETAAQPPSPPMAAPVAPPAPAAPSPPTPAPVEPDAETVARWLRPVASPTPPRPAPEPEMDVSHSSIWRWLAGGNTVVRVGVVILFFGVAFLLKYAHERFHTPIELRLVGVAAGAIALLVIGWRLRERRAGYALTLQGGGIGLLYLVIFSAFRLYGLLTPAAGFALLVAVAALSAVIAVAQDALALAVLGTSGGFLAPILASTGSGSHVMLFSYYGVLNAGIVAIAWAKAWRLLNLVGFAFTFVIGTLWGVSSYRSEHFATTEPFLALFFAFYVAIPILFAHRRAPGLERYVDGTLVFGVPLVAFGLQIGLVHEIEYGAAYSALTLAAVYLVLARAVLGRRGDGLRLLAEGFLALGVVFGTLAIPLALEGRWTSATWALEGAAIVWVGVRQERLPARIFGLGLQFLAGGAFLLDPMRPIGALPFANSAYLGCVFVAVAGLFCAWYLDRHRAAVTESERTIAQVVFGWGIAWWIAGALQEIDRHVPSAYRIATALVFFSASSLAFSWLHARADWRAARYPALAVPPLMALALAATAVAASHPFAGLGFVAWAFAFVAHVLLLRRHESRAGQYRYWAHAAGLWLLAALGSWEVGRGIDQLVAGHAVWPIIGWALVPGSLLLGLALGGMRITWPVAANSEAYFVSGAAPLAVFLAFWTLGVNFVSSGDPYPLPYIPLLNPLDLAQIGAVLAIGLWFVESRRLALPQMAEAPVAPAYAVLAALGFVWANAVLLRTLHHWAGVRFSLEVMLRSDLVQTALSILWGLVALATMVVATRHGVRVAWLAGAGLMGVVVVKLFMVDLSNVGTIMRIVSFIVVGVLMLVLGYVAPVPPRARGEAR